jgi:hypothetical protein
MRAFCLIAFAGLAYAQSTLPPTYGVQTRFNTGQDIVPSFDGWYRNADGTYTMVFGYMNRNYQEEPIIAAGTDNKVEPGPVDQGQPTFFLPRRHAWVFFAKVPADFGNRELVWSITVHGRTEKAYGFLHPEEEILPRLIQSRGNLSPGTENPNKPPELKIQPVTAASVGTAVPLNVDVTDDGLPRPRVPKARAETAAGTAQTNSATARRLPLNVSWMQYGGPAKVTFEPREPVIVSGGKASASARFPQPGSYILRATANDGELQTTADVTVIVR